ncbi:hypothetical protein M514_24008 [Trichuris suis]|uniref:Retrotransposon gag domain-containing protein n=1 Tax=Trichuris suis TaxID=68888 RepID=A0A085N314_9BILA|nr:hypothetical protein M514_24008 [Trichuris suis]
MVRTRGAKSEYSGSEPDEDAVLSGDVGDVVPRRTLREGETSGLAGRGGPWCQPPGTLSSGMDVDVWLGRLDDYLAVNAVPETRWLAIMKSLVDDKIYKNLRCLGPSCSFEQAKSYLLRRYGRGKLEFALRLQFSQRVQQPAESIEDFADELRRLGTEVGKHDADQKAQFIIGLQDANAQRYLLEKVPASFDEALQIAKQFLAVQTSVEDMQRTRQRVAPVACQNNCSTEGSGPSGLDKEFTGGAAGTHRRAPDTTGNAPRRGRTQQKHHAGLEAVFERLRRYNLTVRPDKFCRAQIEFLGFELSAAGLRPLPDEVQD